MALECDGKLFDYENFDELNFTENFMLDCLQTNKIYNVKTLMILFLNIERINFSIFNIILSRLHFLCGPHEAQPCIFFLL